MSRCIRPIGFHPPTCRSRRSRQRTPILHVIGGRPSRELKAGVIDHMAFTADGLAATIAKLEARGLPYDCRRLPDRGTWQLFFHDPNGARIEMDFAADETR